MRCASLLLLLLLTGPSPALAQLRVDAGAAPGGDGTSWATAYSDLQDALAAAGPGSEVWIAEGTYRPDAGQARVPLDRTASFVLPPAVSLHGGFTGVENTLAGRAGHAANTILSGDLLGDDLPDFSRHGDNSLHVLRVTGASVSSVVDRLTIAGGNADGFNDDSKGGGARVELGSQLTFRECIFRSNRALFEGGAVLLTGNSPARFESCEFRDNTAGLDGGGVFTLTSASPVFEACLFEGNSCGRFGGAARNVQANLPQYLDCTFRLNTATDSAGALWNDNAGITIDGCLFEQNSATNLGGALFSTGSPIVRDTIFLQNSAERGGAVYALGLFSSPSFSSCRFESNAANEAGGAIFNTGNPTLADCEFVGNTAVGDGGAFNSSGTGQATGMTRCRFDGNEATRGGGYFRSGTGSASLDRCEFVDNRAAEWGGGLYHGEAVLDLANTTLSGNVSELKGGGAFLANLVAGGELRGCVFEQNSADTVGGGLYLTNSSSPLVTDCRFVANAGQIHGGGVYNTSSEGLGGLSNGRFVRCHFEANVCQEDGAGFFNATTTQGGGECNPTLVDCVFHRNLAGKDGGGLVNIGFAGTASPLLVNVELTGNEAGRHGGGVHNTAPSQLADTFCNPRFWNCVFDANRAVRHGGAYFADSHGARPGNCSSEFVNCTLQGNTAGGEGGAIRNDHASSSRANVLFRNGIVWGNSDVNGRRPSSQLRIAAGRLWVRFSCVEGGVRGQGNISGDPLFLDPLGLDGVAGTLDDDLRLATGSPCLDAGNNAYVEADEADLDEDLDLAESLPRDFDNLTRFSDAAQLDSGTGSGPLVDMGAHESHDCDGNGIGDAQDVFSGATDCNGNHVPDICELTGAFCVTGCETDCNSNGVLDSCEPDCNGNGIPDDCDLAAGASDCNVDLVLDECQPGGGVDCDGNGLDDLCDLLLSPAADCDGDGVLDACELALDPSLDCDGNAVLDLCEIATQVSFDSGALSPIGGLEPQFFDGPLIPSAGDVVLSISASADLALDVTEAIEVRVNSTIVGTVFELGAAACPQIPDRAEVLVPRAIWNQAVQAGQVAIVLLPTADVDGSACGGASFVRVEGELWMSVDDCDMNGVADTCDPDCNANGIPDACDLMDATSSDNDGNGIPDEC